MTSMFDYDDSVNLAFDAKVAGKKVVTAKHELLSKTGEFFFMAHSERELAQRMQMVEEDIEKVAYHKMANVSDSKAKLVRAVLDEWSLRHASCELCKVSSKGDQKDCAECGAPATQHDVRGYLELCDKCAGKKKSSKTASDDGDIHEFGYLTGECKNCGQNTGHARGGQWHCPSGAGCQK